MRKESEEKRLVRPVDPTRDLVKVATMSAAMANLITANGYNAMVQARLESGNAVDFEEAGDKDEETHALMKMRGHLQNAHVAANTSNVHLANAKTALEAMELWDRVKQLDPTRDDVAVEDWEEKNPLDDEGGEGSVS